MTIDELITKLQLITLAHGGNLPVYVLHETDERDVHDFYNSNIHLIIQNVCEPSEGYIKSLVLQ